MEALDLKTIADEFRHRRVDMKLLLVSMKKAACEGKYEYESKLSINLTDESGKIKHEVLTELKSMGYKVDSRVEITQGDERVYENIYIISWYCKG